MGSGPLEADPSLFRCCGVDEDPVGLDVAVSGPGVSTAELVVAVPWFKRSLLDQAPHDVLDLRLIFAALEHQLQVFAELLGVRRCQHDVLNSELLK